LNAKPAEFVCDAATYVTCAGSVSLITRLVTVSVPVFVTTIVYVTVPVGTGAAGACVFTTVIVVVGAATVNPTPFVITVVVDRHGPTPITHAVFDTLCAPHTGATVPVIVKE
jgi:hypothetical protein